MDTHELAWAAGFFDGEGCSSNRRDKSRPDYVSVVVKIGQSDRRPLDRFQKAVLGLGSIGGPYQKKPGHKPVYTLSFGAFHEAQAVVAMLWKWLGEDKRSQAIRVFKAAKLSKGMKDDIARRNLMAYNADLANGKKKLTESQLLARSKTMTLVNQRRWHPQGATCQLS